ncbi:MAG: ATP-dependent helicase [Planctomycetota bacterium]
MPWNEGLEGKALAIAAFPKSPLRVMAGPGTGKSFAIKRRVARLLEEGCDPKRILAVTFTRNAARGLLDDLENLGVDGCEDIRCGTLHGYCFSLLSRDDVFDFNGRVPRPLVTFRSSGVLRFEAAPMIEDLKKAGGFGGGRENTKRVQAFEAAWARMQQDDPGWAVEPEDQAFEEALRTWLTFHKAMLLGELVPEALRYLRENPAATALSAFDHVIVDEYQDLNKAEQLLLDHLAAAGNQAVVGDVDQSIYSFRHANPEGITSFDADRPGTHDETLDECRRCPQLVVQLASHLIRHNHPPGTSARLLPRVSNVDGKVHVVQWQTLMNEAKGLADYIKHLVNKGHSPGEIMVLSPRRMIGYGIRDALVERGVPVHSFYHEEALEASEAQEAFALLTLIASPKDRAALRWWLGHGSPSFRSGPYAVLRQHCESTGDSPRMALKKLTKDSLTLSRTGELVERYRLLRKQAAALKEASVSEAVDMLFPVDQEWAVGLREPAVLALPDVETLVDLRERVTTAVTQPEMPEGGDFVRVMSLHKSKGLTSQTVLVAGCMQGVIPFVDRDASPAEQDRVLREQRRLFYVAVTRCTERLVLSSVTQIETKTAFKINARVTNDGRTMASSLVNELGPKKPNAKVGSTWLTEQTAATESIAMRTSR